MQCVNYIFLVSNLSHFAANVMLRTYPVRSFHTYITTWPTGRTDEQGDTWRAYRGDQRPSPGWPRPARRSSAVDWPLTTVRACGGLSTGAPSWEVRAPTAISCDMHVDTPQFVYLDIDVIWLCNMCIIYTFLFGYYLMKHFVMMSSYDCYDIHLSLLFYCRVE